MNTLKISLDVLPCSKDIWSFDDYSGEQVFNKTALPLFKEKRGRIYKLGAESYLYENNKLIINIRKNLFWNNGDSVVAEDYCRAVSYICVDDANKYKTLLNSVTNNEKEKNRINECIFSKGKYQIIIKTHWFDPFLLWYLSLSQFSPKHEINSNLSAGPYNLYYKSKYSYKLKQNPHYRLSQFKNSIAKIEFLLIPEDKKATSWKERKVNVTCDTAVDLRYYKKFLNSPNFFRSNNKLLMFLLPGNLFSELNDEIKQILSLSINKNRISHHFDETLKPIYSTIRNSRLFFCKKKKNLNPLSKKFILHISYEDFYPNKEILEMISDQLKEFNILIILHIDEYGNRSSSCHLKFVIRKSLKNHPIFLIRSNISYLKSNSKNIELIQKLYSMLFSQKCIKYQKLIFEKIEKIIIENNIIFPLFIFPTGFFCSSEINYKTLNAIGSFIRFKAGANDI